MVGTAKWRERVHRRAASSSAPLPRRGEDCRLAKVERRLLGIAREKNCSGSEMPTAWRPYRRGGCVETLRRVGHRNAQELRSLCLLPEHFAH